MTLQDIFDQLTYGELRLMEIGGEEDEGITEDNRYQIITHINMGLAALHRRFFLKKGETTLYVNPNIDTYTIDAQDMFKIERILKQTDEGPEDVPIGMGGPESISMDSLNTVRVPLELRLEGLPMRVIYRANHPKLDKRTASRDPERTEVELPDSHMEALLYFVASRMFNPLSANAEFHEGNNYYQKFEMACKALENQGLQISESAKTTKFEARGFV